MKRSSFVQVPADRSIDIHSKKGSQVRETFRAQRRLRIAELISLFLPLHHGSKTRDKSKTQMGRSDSESLSC
jgi:RecA-family ATPase